MLTENNRSPSQKKCVWPCSIFVVPSRSIAAPSSRLSAKSKYRLNTDSDIGIAGRPLIHAVFSVNSPSTTIGLHARGVGANHLRSDQLC